MSEAAPMDAAMGGVPVGRGPERGRGGFRGVLRRLGRGLWNLLPHRLMFNPVFWKDSAISARKKGTFAFRGLYMCLLLVAVVVTAIPQASMLAFAGPAGRMQAASMFAGTLAQVIQWTQLFALMAVGSILSASAIAQERTNRSLDSLYATPLTRMQIMWGKFASRMLQILVLALMPLPILLMLRAFGGIDAMVTLMQTVLILCAAAMSTSMGLFASVHSKRPWAVIGSTSMVLMLLHLIGPMLAFRLQSGLGTPLWLMLGGFAIAPGYPFAAVSFSGMWGMLSGGVIGGVVLVVGVAVASQLGLAALITSCAALLLRRIEKPRGSGRGRAATGLVVSAAAGDAAGSDAPSGEGVPVRKERGARASRVVGDWPVLWRELRQPTIDFGRFGWLRWVMYPLIGLAIAVLFFVRLPDGTRPYQESYSYIILFSSIGFYVLIVSMTRTTSLIPHERSARTWDVLRTTPIEPLMIVVQKYVGAMAKPLLVVGVLLATMVPAVWQGLLHWSVVPFLLLSMLQGIGLLGATGLLVGTMLRKGLAATAANLGVALVLWLILPIVVTVVGDGLQGRHGMVLIPNPMFQIGVSFAGCYELAPVQAQERMVPGGYRYYMTVDGAFHWPDENRTAGQHLFLLIGSGLMYLVLIGGCLYGASLRLERMSPAG